MSRYYYGDQILDAFIIFRRPLTMDEVIGYVAEITNKSVAEIRLDVDNTLTAAWAYGFVKRQNNQYTLSSGVWDHDDPTQNKREKHQHIKLLLKTKWQYFAPL
ncbi:uncharacterized protein LOC115629524 [Scaptodrosophila lebanonensis]|uniref:Uncharacterized protein LOC115629524 n=1 Tax=Drosophila lebanonensis TaxID=7225 RepID=A0A6J2U0I7_DROLE|nr:uncharacterized protein LOC115629524 [Scaptodrosophila lebanonensis]